MRGHCRAEWYEALVADMLLSNAEASRILAAHGVRAVTDVTGFGLAGHLLEMLDASGVAATLTPLAPLGRGVGGFHRSPLAPLGRGLGVPSFSLAPLGRGVGGEGSSLTLPGFDEMIAAGVRSTMHAKNAKLTSRITGKQPAWLFDPRTAGGLLAGVPAIKVETIVQTLRAAGYMQTNVIGSCTSGKPAILLREVL